MYFNNFFFCFTFWSGMSKNPQNTLYHKVSLTLNINQELIQDDPLRKCRSLGRLWVKRKPWSPNSTYSTQSASNLRQFFFCLNTRWKILFNNPVLPYLLMNFQAFSLDRVRVSIISTSLLPPLLFSISCNPKFILQCWSTTQGTRLTNDQWTGIWNPSKTSIGRRQTLEGDSNTAISLYYPDTNKNPAKIRYNQFTSDASSSSSNTRNQAEVPQLPICWWFPYWTCQISETNNYHVQLATKSFPSQICHTADAYTAMTVSQHPSKTEWYVGQC